MKCLNAAGALFAAITALTPMQAAACYKHTFDKCDGAAPIVLAAASPTSTGQAGAVVKPTPAPNSVAADPARDPKAWVTTVRVER